MRREAKGGCKRRGSKDHARYLWQIMEMAAIPRLLDFDLDLKVKDTDWQHQPADDKITRSGRLADDICSDSINISPSATCTESRFKQNSFKSMKFFFQNVLQCVTANFWSDTGSPKPKFTVSPHNSSFKYLQFFSLHISHLTGGLALFRL